MGKPTPLAARALSRLSDRFAGWAHSMARRMVGGECHHSALESALERVLAPPESKVIDAGANVGQFAELVFRACPSAHVISIDPIPGNVEACRERFSNRPGYQVIWAALGEEDRTQVEFNVLPFSQASSILKPTAIARDAFRSLATTTRQINVAMHTLDDLLASLNDSDPIALLKLDVEGFEAPVLRGAKQTLSRSKSLLVECQTQPMNEGAELFDEVCHQARQAGMRFTKICGEVRDLYGDLLMFDLLFERN